MKIEELEAAALMLDPKGRARLAERLLESLDSLSPEENAQIWAEEAQRRAAARARRATLSGVRAAGSDRCVSHSTNWPSVS